jgi:hypothetical protein
MTHNDIIHLLAGLVGGGLIATVISIWAQSRAARRAAELRYLEDALNHVYAPVRRLLTTIEMLFKQSRDIFEKSSAHFSQNWAPSAMESVRREHAATIEVANKYVEVAKEKIDEIIAITSGGSHLIDPNDMKLFDEIQLHRVRIQLEFESPCGKEVPHEILLRCDAPSFYKESWLTQIEASYERKLARYKVLMGMHKRAKK